MTPTALRELAAEMRSIMCDDEMSRGEIYRWADKLESLAGAQEAVPILLSDSAIHAKAPWIAAPHYPIFRAGYESGCLAMIEAAERQEKP